MADIETSSRVFEHSSEGFVKQTGENTQRRFVRSHKELGRYKQDIEWDRVREISTSRLLVFLTILETFFNNQLKGLQSAFLFYFLGSSAQLLVDLLLSRLFRTEMILFSLFFSLLIACIGSRKCICLFLEVD